jgi:nucleotide-binding universal stress UspA family protein
MSYKVIATIVTDTEGSNAPVNAAIALAERFGAHLDIHAVTMLLPDRANLYFAAEATLTAAHLRNAATRHAALRSSIESRMRAEILPWTLHDATIQAPGLAEYLARKLRFSDLVVLPRPYQKGTTITVAQLVEACLFSAHRPVFMVPDTFDLPAFDGRILLGWNSGAEAMAAAQAALPFLRNAAQVEICVIDPPRHAADRSDPGGAIAQYLMRQGAHAEVSVMAGSNAKAGELLVRHAREVGADLIVAGAYGHSRLREAVFGGATRSLLESATGPILMAR